ncbi:hypothetical protein [Galactobacter sp.]|uniref:hypothetical protein n=1 Tax=Galactobacter sp. TaxID=2676125 RepID=UPI0025C2B25D|nr:hypothetical protein [Galactobacter sp.]
MTSIVTPFPDPGRVFTDQSWMERVLASIAVVELEDGTTFPVVIPFEPAVGRLGERTRDVHTVFASADRMGFRLLPNGTVDFLGDPEFFELIHRAQRNQRSRSLTAFYEDQYAGFHSARTSGVLPDGCIEEFDPDLAWLDQDMIDDPAGDDGDDGDDLGFDVNAAVAATRETMPNGTPFTKVLTVDPSALLPRSNGTFTVWWEPASSTVLVTRND